MKLPRPINRSTYMRLVGALSTLAAQGTVEALRRRTPPRVRDFPRRVPVQRLPTGETARMIDDLVSRGLPGGDTKTPLDI